MKKCGISCGVPVFLEHFVKRLQAAKMCDCRYDMGTHFSWDNNTLGDLFDSWEQESKDYLLNALPTLHERVTQPGVFRREYVRRGAECDPVLSESFEWVYPCSCARQATHVTESGYKYRVHFRDQTEAEYNLAGNSRDRSQRILIPVDKSLGLPTLLWIETVSMSQLLDITWVQNFFGSLQHI